VQAQLVAFGDMQTVAHVTLFFASENDVFCKTVSIQPFLESSAFAISVATCPPVGALSWTVSVTSPLFNQHACFADETSMSGDTASQMMLCGAWLLAN